ncbi:unnamed protein product, partial [Rotaria magnacalcarata]
RTVRPGNRDIRPNQRHDYCNDHFKKDENADAGNDRNKLLPSCNHHNHKSLNHTKYAARRTIINYERAIDKPLTINSNLKAYRIYNSNDAGNYAVYRPSYDIQNARIVRRKNNRTSQMKIYDSEELFLVKKNKKICWFLQIFFLNMNSCLEHIFFLQ